MGRAPGYLPYCITSEHQWGPGLPPGVPPARSRLQGLIYHVSTLACALPGSSGRPPCPPCTPLAPFAAGEIAGGANCKPACSRPDVCQQMGSTKRWRCAPPRPTPSLPRRRQPLLKPRQAAAAATAAAAAAVDPDVDGGEESGDGPGLYGKRATAAVDGSEQGRGPEGESGDPGLPSPQA